MKIEEGKKLAKASGKEKALGHTEFAQKVSEPSAMIVLMWAPLILACIGLTSVCWRTRLSPVELTVILRLNTDGSAPQLPWARACGLLHIMTLAPFPGFLVVKILCREGYLRSDESISWVKGFLLPFSALFGSGMVFMFWLIVTIPH